MPSIRQRFHLSPCSDFRSHFCRQQIWPREAQDLSQWVKDNVDLLSEALGLQIEFDEAEGQVGNFRLDLAGYEGTSQRPVVVENQFGKTDHAHLGKLITYAAGREAGVLVWIANMFREPHRRALEWLNRTSDEDLLFYGVELQVWQIDNSKPAPRYNVVAKPPLQKMPVLPSEPSGRTMKYQAFWAKLLEYVRTNYPNVVSRSITPPVRSYISTHAGVTGFFIGSAFTIDKRFRVELYIDTGDRQRNKRAFAALHGSQEEIERAIGEELDWDEIPDKRASRISVYRTGWLDEATQQVNDYVAWAAQRMALFREVFQPRLKELELE